MIAWWEKAAAQGHPAAQYDLGVLYYEGSLVPQSERKAVELWLKSAAQGTDNAQYNLAVMYHQGTGVDLSDENAYAWVILSAAQGYELALKMKATLEGELTPLQKALGKKLSKQLGASIEKQNKSDWKHHVLDKMDN